MIGGTKCDRCDQDIRRPPTNFRPAVLVFTDHHEAHAASAFFPSPYDRAAILTSDGVGEWATTTWGVGNGSRFELKHCINFPHSLGLLYSAFTYFAGFKVNSGEYKLMGLAPYGSPVYVDLIKEKLVDVKSDGSFRLNMDYFTYPQSLRMTGNKFTSLFGGPPRAPEAVIGKREMDLAASIQAVTEEILTLTARHIRDVTKERNLCLAGGVALNCVATGKIVQEGIFDDVWIQPAAGDAGGALGCALFTWHQLLERPRTPGGRDAQQGSLLGPSYRMEEIAGVLAKRGVKYVVSPDETALLERVAELLDRGMVVGWFQGRMEFGPRALGARSILGDARSATMQATMNLKIKHRESFRPFAPCVLRERAHEVFDMRQSTESPYMLLVADVRDELRRALTDEERRTMDDPDLRHRVNVCRSEYPAITHVDYSARVQTVDEERHGRFYRLLKAFERRTGAPLLVNTSFNVRGEPIVNSPDEALTCFLATGMDALAIGDAVVLKTEQAGLAAEAAGDYLARFELD
jgi:carbamoyltransferase